MAGKPPRPGPSRATFQPGPSKAEPPRRGTQMVRASEVKRTREDAPAPAPPPPVDLAGASTGRGLKLDDSPPPVASDAGGPDPDELSPFQRFAPRAEHLSGAAQARSGESLQVLAIVFGLVFMIGAAAVVSLFFVGIGWYTMGDLIEDGTLAGLDPEHGHIGDTDVPDDIVKKTPTGKPKSGAGGEAAAEPEPTGPTTGPGTILINGDVLFHSIEVNCPSSGIRARADFRNNRATARGLPTNEDCTITFQGSQPARATLRGNQTKSCTFDPTLCRLQ